MADDRSAPLPSRSHLGQPVTACYLPVTRCRPAPPVIPYGAICLRENPNWHRSLSAQQGWAWKHDHIH